MIRYIPPVIELIPRKGEAKIKSNFGNFYIL